MGECNFVIIYMSQMLLIMMAMLMMVMVLGQWVFQTSQKMASLKHAAAETSCSAGCFQAWTKLKLSAAVAFQVARVRFLDDCLNEFNQNQSNLYAIIMVQWKILLLKGNNPIGETPIFDFHDYGRMCKILQQSWFNGR